MSKIKVTQQQRDNALFARDVMWKSVPPGNVVAALRTWRIPEGEPVTCGTLACFGGWVAVHPYFQAQGVRADSDGAPSKPSPDLFGAWLFHPREVDERGTDHEIVTKRLDKLIRNSEVVA